MGRRRRRKLPLRPPHPAAHWRRSSSRCRLLRSSRTWPRTSFRTMAGACSSGSRLGLAWVLVAALLILVTAYEGLICLLMALPLILPVVMLGVMVGYFLIGGHRSGP